MQPIWRKVASAAIDQWKWRSKGGDMGAQNHHQKGQKHGLEGGVDGASIPGRRTTKLTANATNDLWKRDQKVVLIEHVAIVELTTNVANKQWKQGFRR